jgi:hypothetical protein
MTPGAELPQYWQRKESRLKTSKRSFFEIGSLVIESGFFTLRTRSSGSLDAADFHIFAVVDAHSPPYLVFRTYISLLQALFQQRQRYRIPMRVDLSMHRI